MVIEINIQTVLLGLLLIVAVIAVIYLIIVLKRVSDLLAGVNKVLITNNDNIDSTLSNVKGITDNVKDISDVAVETTAEAIVLKEGLVNQVDTLKEIINIVAAVFTKR